MDFKIFKVSQPSYLYDVLTKSSTQIPKYYESQLNHFSMINFSVIISLSVSIRIKYIPAA